MSPHVEIESTRSLAGAVGGTFWGWEIPVYLFLGGLVAGLLVTVSAAVLVRGRERVTPAMRTGLVLAPVLLGLGMGALFLDLTYKAHVFRFYTAFRPTSPMSWGSWILLLVVPVQLGLIAALPPRWLAERVESFRSLRRWASIVRFCESHVKGLAVAGVTAGAALGVYTGILLSATVARPLWSSGALGALFLASGTSTGIAALMLMEREHESHESLARLDIVVIGVEVALLAMWIIGLLGQGPVYREAAARLLDGSFAPAFLGIVVFGGLLVPAALEVMALRGRAMTSRSVPALVLLGGFLLRVVVVYAGQMGGFVRA
jgi:protein NrfD